MTAIPPDDNGRPHAVSPDTAEARRAPTAPRESGDPNGEWWIDGPIFSTEHKGSGITTLRPGAKPGRFTGSMIARLVITFIFWIGFAFLSLPRMFDPIAAPPVEDLATHWWWWVIVIVIVVVMVWLGPTFGFTRRAMEQYGQLGLPALTAALVFTAAFFVALLIHLAIDIDYIRNAPPTVEYWELPDADLLVMMLGLAAVGTLVLLIALPFSIHVAVKRQRMIVAVRTTGTRYAGRLEPRDFKNSRISNLSQFSVRVGFETPKGHRVVTARMGTDPGRVPLVGQPLLVIVLAVQGRRGSREQILIEPDPNRRMRFDPASRKYMANADGGSG